MSAESTDPSVACAIPSVIDPIPQGEPVPEIEGDNNQKEPLISQEVPIIEPGDVYKFDEDIQVCRILVEWVARSKKQLCDLDLIIYCYDERARFIEKLDGSRRKSKDGSCLLMTDLDNTDSKGAYIECVRIDLTRVNNATSAILLFLDGGPRHFQNVENIVVTSVKTPLRANTGFVPTTEASAQNESRSLFHIVGKSKRDYHGICLCALYKDGWNSQGETQWVTKAFLEPVYASTAKLKDEKCAQVVVGAVPALEKFRPRLFPNVASICAALSSNALPLLKKTFLATPGGLQIGAFTEVLFKQLYGTHPKVADMNEAPYVVAMLQEMFSQIDYNGDNSTDWDEFTTFCIQMSVNVDKTSGGSGGGGGDKGSGGDPASGDTHKLDEYVIEYAEMQTHRDHFLSAHRKVALMKYIPSTQKIMIINEESDFISVCDHKFQLKSILNPLKLFQSNRDGTVKENQDVILSQVIKLVIHDAVYLQGRDLYALCSSDHCISIVRELASITGKVASFTDYRKIYHSLLHVKLCWSQKEEILCSVASDKSIYGWNIDTSIGSTPVFVVSRHNDIITDFLSVDNLELFATCSMDKRIVLWSQSTRRVKAVLLGHKRGIRTLSAYETTLLSTGFELDARTWDMFAKEPVAILRGHRFPIVCGKLMCEQSLSDRDYRAVTVDEQGEFRLWDIHVKERTGEPRLVPCLQIFEMKNPAPPVNEIRFIAVPFNKEYCQGYYSDLIACSSKLLHFLPEKNSKEFSPPTCCVFHEPAAQLVACVGKNLLKYDVTTGNFVSMFREIHRSEFTALSLDGDRGRKIYIGCNNGDILLVNFVLGQIIDSLEQCHSKEVTTLTVGTANHIYSGSLDGKIRMIEETGGSMNIHNTIECAFGEGIGVTSIKHHHDLKVIVASSVSISWGVWNDSNFKKLLIIEEQSPVLKIEILGGSGDKDHLAFLKKMRPTATKVAHQKYKLLTVAVALQTSVRIYTVDILDARGVASYELTFQKPVYITDMQLLRSPESADYVNYSTNKQRDTLTIGLQLIAVTDDGSCLLWDCNHIRTVSDQLFHKVFAHQKVIRKPQLDIVTSPGGGYDYGDGDGGGSRRHSQSLQSPKMSPSNYPSSPTSRKSSMGALASPKGSPRSLSMSLSPTAASVTATAASFLTSIDIATEVDGGGASTSETVNPNSAAAPTPGFESHMFEISSNDFGPPREIKCNTNSWQAHTDAASLIIPLHDHGCFVTVSFDGYFRVWNIEQDCLGELVLPNVTEQMRKGKLQFPELVSGWKFILEKIPVTNFQKEVAAILVGMVTQSKSKPSTAAGGNDRRKAASDLLPLKSITLGSEETPCDNNVNAQERLRSSVLKALNEPSVITSELPPSAHALHEAKMKLKEAELEKLAISHIPSVASTLGANGRGVGTSVGFGGVTTISHPKHHPLAEGSSSVLKLGGALDAGGSMGTLGVAEPPNMMASQGKGDTHGSYAPPSRQKLQSRSTPSLGASRSLATLWSSSEELTNSMSTKAYFTPPAFSELSLAAASHDKLIDGYGHRILRQINKGTIGGSGGVEKYDRAAPMMFLRSAKMSTTVELPKINEIDRSEVAFGEQKDMYKNASTHLNEHNNLSKYQMRHSITLSRIELSAHRVNSMVHLIESHVSDDVNISMSGENRKEAQRAEDLKMRLRLLQSAAAVPLEAALRRKDALDKKALGTWNEKVERSSTIDTDDKARETVVNKKKGRVLLSQQAKEELENKLKKTMRDCFRAMKMVKEEEKHLRIKVTVEEMVASTSHNLTTRALLPFYKLDDVKHFMDIFAKVDEDFSGDLDIKEWTKLFSSLNANIPTSEARTIFVKCDKQQKGYLTMRDLVPVIFSKATRAQQRLIIDFAEATISKSAEGIVKLSPSDVEQIFEMYDVEDVGFVQVGYFRERLRALRLPEMVQFHFLDSIASFEDDDMVSNVEFHRMLRPYISRGE